MTEIPATEQTEYTEDATVQSRSKFARSADRILIGWFIFVVVMQIFMRLFWEPSFGEAIKNLITYAQIQLSVLLVLAWWFFFSPLSRKTVWMVGFPVILLIVGWVMSIRRIDFDGDVNARIEYFWDESAEERLETHRSQAETAEVEDIELVDVDEQDMPAYRGINRDGIVIGPELRTDWESNPPTELWRQPIGGGYSSFSVAGRQLITLEQRGENEAVVCYDTETGREYWTHSYQAYFTEALGGPGPRSTPTIHNEAVYSFGGFGDLFKLDLKTGEPIWHVNSLQQFGLPNTMWAMTSSPLIYKQTVIVNIGGLPGDGVTLKEGGGLIAYDLETGNLAWFGAALPEPDRDRTEFDTGSIVVEGLVGKTVPGYSSPMLVTLAGEEVLLNFDGTAFRGHNPEDGEQYWSFPFKAGDHINVAQPLVFDDDRVMISAGYGMGSVMFQVSKNDGNWQLKELWEKPSLRLRSKFSSPVLYEGYVYGLDETIMTCIDPADGSRKWKGRRGGLRGKYGFGQLLLTNGQIVVLTEKGQLVLIDPNPEELTVLGALQVLDDRIKTWNPFAMSRGKVFVRNAEEVACYDLRANPSETSSEIAKANDDTDKKTEEQSEDGL